MRDDICSRWMVCDSIERRSMPVTGHTGTEPHLLVHKICASFSQRVARPVFVPSRFAIFTFRVSPRGSGQRVIKYDSLSRAVLCKAYMKSMEHDDLIPTLQQPRKSGK